MLNALILVWSLSSLSATPRCEKLMLIGKWTHPHLAFQIWRAPNPLEYHDELERLEANASSPLIRLLRRFSDQSIVLEQNFTRIPASVAALQAVDNQIARQNQAYAAAIAANDYSALARTNIQRIRANNRVYILNISSWHEPSVDAQMRSQQKQWIATELKLLIADLRIAVRTHRHGLRVAINIDQFLSPTTDVDASLAVLGELLGLAEDLNALHGQLIVTVVTERWEQWKSHLLGPP